MENSRPKVEAWNQPTQPIQQPQYTSDNKRILTGVLALLMGHLGVHKFVLGYNSEGFIILTATVIGYATMCIFIGIFVLVLTTLLGLIEGIIYLSKTDAQFYEMYQKNKKPWF